MLDTKRHSLLIGNSVVIPKQKHFKEQPLFSSTHFFLFVSKQRSLKGTDRFVLHSNERRFVSAKHFCSLKLWFTARGNTVLLDI